MIRPEGKDPISEYKKSMVSYQFNCFCKDMSERLKGNLVKEHILKGIDEYWKWVVWKINLKRVLNASKTSAIAELLA